MGKREPGKFEKRSRDYYPTLDPDAVKPLLPFLWGMNFGEPCCGSGDLIRLVEAALPGLRCNYLSDIEPNCVGAIQRDATAITPEDVPHTDYFLTNPPFSWDLLKPLLDHLPTIRPTWLLLPADCIFNRRMGPYMQKCHAVVAVGRLWWLPNKVKGVDNFIWALWDHNVECEQTIFYGRD